MIGIPYWTGIKPLTVQDHEDLAKILAKVQSKWLLTYNDHPRVRELYLGYLSGSKATTVRQLRAVQASTHYITVLGSDVTIAGTVRVAANIHEKAPGQERRNKISDKTMAALDEVYELLQAKAFAGQQLLNAAGYPVVARLAEVNETILRDAAYEELFEKLEALEQVSDEFEENARQLGARGEGGCQERSEAAGRSF